MTSSSNSSQSTHPRSKNECFGKNYSSFLDFTHNYERTSEFLSPETWLGYGDLGLIFKVTTVQTTRRSSLSICSLDTPVFSLNNTDYSWIQDFEADFNSCIFYFSVYLKTNDHLNLKLLIFEPWHVISQTMLHFDKCRLRRACADPF